MTFTPKKSTYGGIDEEALKAENGITGFTKPEEGYQYLLIEDVYEGPDKQGREITLVTFRSMYNKAKFGITQYMMNKEGTGLSYWAIHWLNSLGYAVCGIRTALDREDLIGRVVAATVKLAPSYKDKKQYEAEIEEHGVSTVPLYAQVGADDIEPVTESVVKEFCAPDKQDQFFIEE